MSKTLFLTGGALALSALSGVAEAGQLTVSVDVPQPSVAEYHRPYVAGWIEDGATGADISNLFVWYGLQTREGHGQKYLPELRSWWRKSGRDLTLPADGLTSATRAPGRQTIAVDAKALSGLKPGSYNFVVEAARESGGRNLIKVPFTWNGKALSVTGQGQGELGQVSLTYKP